MSVFLSAAVFTFGHQSPGKSLEIFIFGKYVSHLDNG